MKKSDKEVKEEPTVEERLQKTHREMSVATELSAFLGLIKEAEELQLYTEAYIAHAAMRGGTPATICRHEGVLTQIMNTIEELKHYTKRVRKGV